MSPVLRWLGRATRNCAVVGALLFGLLVAVPGGASAQSASAMVATLGQQAIQVLGPSVPVAQRQARFRELFRNDFDVPGIGQFVLGRYWRTATPQEQQDFLGLFQEFLVRAYSTRLGEYGGEPFRVIGERPAGEQTIVTSQIIRQNGQPIEVDWYLVNRGGALKITDVYVAGVSMKVTHRDEFSSILQRNGGRVEALIAELRQKLAAR